MKYSIKVQENNVIRVTPKITESLVDKILKIKGVLYTEENGGNYTNIILDEDYKNKVKLEINYLIK